MIPDGPRELRVDDPMPPADSFDGRRHLDQSQVEAFAERVLNTLESKSALQNVQDLRVVSEWLYAQVMSGDMFSCKGTVKRLGEMGVASSDVIDFCIPDVAGRIGQMWVDDEASFAVVTLVSSRLYSLCKELAEGWEARPRQTGQPTILVAISPGEQHMIGSIVMASQLRRKGCSVQLLAGAGEKEVVSCIRHSRFDAVLISCAGTQALDSAVALIARIRKEVKKPPRLVVGGAIEKQVKLTTANTGADLVTSDIEKAIAGLARANTLLKLLAAQ